MAAAAGAFRLNRDPSVRKFQQFWWKQEKLTKAGIRKGYLALRRDLIQEARRAIRRPPKTGVLYRIPGRRRRHRASAPEEAPANLTGNLARSINAEQRGWGELHFGASAKYARALELGNPSGNLKPRPYLIRAIEASEGNAREHFEREIEAKLTLT